MYGYANIMEIMDSADVRWSRLLSHCIRNNQSLKCWSSEDLLILRKPIFYTWHGLECRSVVCSGFMWDYRYNTEVAHTASALLRELFLRFGLSHIAPEFNSSTLFPSTLSLKETICAHAHTQDRAIGFARRTTFS